ncbi:uncharacterized protein N7511_006477 [Penicillium nucicola]|uniref:uncharacterized protein n=1 Tax=Penicillium nucicola TaxID=1850975 RepID=UPI0025459205|nr:uncharacterized protein N7511_006477 [Penicillium nucicola]KAJ5757783.1 hypothetical protein N7511_006477 [Penicillium nucicola]
MTSRDLGVQLVIDQNRVASIQSNFVSSPMLPSPVLPSTNVPNHDQPVSMSPSPRVKRKLHEMILRSDTRQASEDAILLSSSPLSSPPSSSVIEAGRPSTYEPTLAGSHSVHETEARQPPESLRRSYRGAYSTPAQFPVTPTSNGSRVWATRHPASQDFIIWEDAHRGQTPIYIQEDEPLSFSPQDEDKENTFATRSDLSSSDEETQQSRTLSRNTASHRDAFGIPLTHPISDFVDSTRTNPEPEPVTHPRRDVLRAIWVLETEDIGETSGIYDGTVSQTQIREVEEVEAVYQRGYQSRARNNRHSAFRHGTAVQAQTNFNTDLRRIFEPQRRESRRNVPDGDGGEN